MIIGRILRRIPEKILSGSPRNIIVQILGTIFGMIFKEFDFC